VLLIIINYIIKIFIILFGFILLTGVFLPDIAKTEITPVIGVIFIFWGVYRIYIYNSKLKRYRNDSDEED
jgi:hypothetical protein